MANYKIQGFKNTNLEELFLDLHKFVKENKFYYYDVKIVKLKFPESGLAHEENVFCCMLFYIEKTK